MTPAYNQSIQNPYCLLRAIIVFPPVDILCLNCLKVMCFLCMSPVPNACVAMPVLVLGCFTDVCFVVFFVFLINLYFSPFSLKASAICQASTVNKNVFLMTFGLNKHELIIISVKEVNGLQWEITFNQVQLKKFEQSWEQKFNRLDFLLHI